MTDKLPVHALDKAQPYGLTIYKYTSTKKGRVQTGKSNNRSYNTTAKRSL